MGDRGNIITRCRYEKICLYTHDLGYDLPETLRQALIKGKDRWDDFQYLNRIIFCQMMSPDAFDKTTGFGITQHMYDDDHDGAIIVDIDKQTVQIPNDNELSFEDYITQERTWERSKY